MLMVLCLFGLNFGRSKITFVSGKSIVKVFVLNLTFNKINFGLVWIDFKRRKNFDSLLNYLLIDIIIALIVYVDGFVIGVKYVAGKIEKKRLFQRWDLRIGNSK